MPSNEAHKLIKKSDLISLRRELGVGLNPNLANELSWNLLMLAAFEGDTTVGELLISKGADVDAINALGETALSLAAHGDTCPSSNCCWQKERRRTAAPTATV
jgi:uncharacterized protein